MTDIKTEDRLRIGIVAPDEEVRRQLATEVARTGIAETVAECGEYCSSVNRSMLGEEREPEIVLVESTDPLGALETISELHARLPQAWLLLILQAHNPDLIIQAVRAGSREFLTRPVSAEHLKQAFGRYAEERQRTTHERRTGRIYTVTSGKGGSGATFVAVNLAAAIADLPETSVNLIDLNTPVGDAAAYLNLKPSYTVGDALAAGDRLDSVLLESYASRKNKIAVLPGSRDFIGEQITEKMQALQTTLKVACQTYSHIVVDLPSHFPRNVMELLSRMSSDFLIVLTPELPALWRSHQLLGFLESCGAAPRIRLILNRSDTNDEITHSQVQKALSREVYWNLPNDYRRSIEAVNAGKPLVSLNGSRLASSYHELASRLTGIEPVNRKKGFLGLFN
ncbi:MAG TPA: hypothetical protein VKZ59_10115 [Acidobacteriota bacterium]|nr:hypothetical protein [Acidobacteriota bacterium]